MLKIKRRRNLHWFRLLCCIVLFTFSINTIGEDAARAWSIAEPQNTIMPAAGTLIPSSPVFSLPTLKAISVDPNDPFKIDFVVDSADQSLTQKVGQEEVNLLIKYFLSFLALPQEDLWVNLSPYEKGHIIPPAFEITNAGRDMLVQDYILKQLAASLTYPDHEIGKAFWKKVFDRVQAEYGTLDIPVTSFNKVWVVPDRAIVYEENGSAFIAESRLKVLTEEDYLSIEKSGNNRGMFFSKRQKVDHIFSEITREIIIPELEREVNEGKYFAPLRQMYNSLILAIWFKKRYKEHLITQVYVDQKKTSGISLSEKQIKERIYAQYLRALKRGAYNFIREDYDEKSQQTIPRKYFSGGFSFVDAAMHVTFLPASRLLGMRDQIGVFKKGLYRFTVALNPLGISKAKLLSLVAGTVMMAGGISQAHAATSVLTPQVINDMHQAAVTLVQLSDTYTNDAKSSGILSTNIQLINDAHRAAGMLRELTENTDLSPPLLVKEKEALKTFVSPAYVEGSSNDNDHRTLHNAATALDEAIGRKINDGNSQNDDLGNALIKLESAVSNIILNNGTQTRSPATPTTSTPPPVAPIIVPPVAPVIVPPMTPQVKESQSNIRSYTVSSTVVPIAVEDHVVAGNNGIVADIDPDKKEYKAGEPILFLLDPELSNRIDQLNTEIEIRKKQLSDLETLFDKQAATSQEVTVAQQHVDETSQKLAQAYQEKTANVVTAPHNLTIRDILVVNGMKVTQGSELLKYYDKQRVRINFNIPTTVNYFNRIDDLTINGETIKSIPSVDWSVDPLQKSAQVSLVGISSAAIPVGQSVVLKANILSPNAYSQNLNSIVGQTQTIASVRKIEQYVLKSPADGPVRFLVHDGQAVQAGQVLAVVENKHYSEEYQSIRLAMNGINLQLKQATDPDGTLLITRDKLDNLNIQKAALISELNKVRIIMERLEVRSPGSGVVNGLAAYESNVFQEGNELLRIGTGNALVGDANDIKNPILFPRGLTINSGDPVVIETPQGVHLPGRVTVVNKTPYHSTMNLNGFQALEVMAFDQQGILQPNLPVKIILLKDEERQMVLDALMSIEKTTMISVSAGSPPPPDKEVKQDTFILPGLTNTANAGLTTVAAAPSKSPSSVDLNKVGALIDRNSLVIGALAIEVLQKKREEDLPRATRLSISGGVWMKDGKLYFGGGLRGVLNNSIGGGIQSGNAIGAAVPLVFQLAGNIIDVVSGKVAKETDLAKKMTEIAVYHMDTEVYRQVNEGQNLLIDIGAAKEKMAQLKGLLADLQKARSVMLARESGGFSLKLERDEIEKNIQDVQAQILALQEKEESWTVALNVLTGQSNTDLHHSIDASLPWGKQFPTINEQKENKMRASLIDTTSPNSKMKEAVAVGSAVDMTVKLQGLDKLPALNFSSIYLSDGTGSSSFYNLSSNEYLQRTSALTQGENSGAQVEIPLFDSVVKTKEGIMALEKQKSDLNIEKTQAELSQELGQAAGSIRSLSEQIQQAETAYQDAYHVLELKAKRPDIYLPYQLVNDRMEMVKLAQGLIDLKAQYFKKEADLRKMGLLGAETATQDNPISAITNSFQTMVSDSISEGMGEDLKLFTMPELPEISTTQQEHLLAPGVINYHIEDTPGAWALMHQDLLGPSAGPLEIVKQMLIDEPNIFVRTDALHHFLDEYQSSREFFPALNEVVLHSAHPDVVWGLFKFMEQQEDHGIPFFIQIIQEAQANKNQSLADLGFQFLGDVFTMYPETCQNLTPSDFITDGTSLYTQVSSETVNKILLTFMLRAPDDSIAKERLLQSDYWKTDDLAKIHNSLIAYVGEHPDEAGLDKIKNLAGLIYDSILRKEALGHIDEIFRQGSFGQIGEIPRDEDIINLVERKEHAGENRHFLSTSPEWRRMQYYIHPRLYASAREATQNLLSINPAGPSGVPFYNLPHTQHQYDEFAYFNGLGLDGQSEYISNSHNIPELARILTLQTVSQTPVRAAVLDRLMKDDQDQGRFLVLEAYINSSDPELLGLIESHPWQAVLKKDIQNVKDSADYRILRSALEKMYDRRQEQWALNMRLMTYDVLELHMVKDPRGKSFVDAQINVAATRIALKVLDEEMNYRWVLWTGYSLQNPGESQERANIDQILGQEIDPTIVNHYVENQLGTVKDKNIKKMLTDVIAWRDEIAVRIRNNDQNIPPFTTLFIVGVIAIFMIPLSVLIKKLFYKIWLRTASNQNLQESILRKQLGKVQENKDSAMLPPPGGEIRVLESTKDALNLWYSLISKWRQEEKLPAGAILDDFNTILRCAEEVLRDMPYSPDLMWNQGKAPNNGIYQSTFYYFNNITLNTLDILQERLQVEGLSQVDREGLEDDINALFEDLNYNNRFSRILAYRGNIYRVMSYKFPNDNWREWTGIYPFIRTVLLYQYLWKGSEKRLKKELPVLLHEGNSLFEGFYQDTPKMIGESARLLKIATDNARTSNDNTISWSDRMKDRKHNFNRRVLTLLGLFIPLASVGSLLLGVSSLILEGLSISGLFVLAYSSLQFWQPHYDFVQLTWSIETAALVKNLKRQLGPLLNPSGIKLTVNNEQNSDEEIVALNKKEGEEQARIELDETHAPNVDMIVIIPQEEEDIIRLKNYVNSRRGKLIRNDIPAVVMPSKYQGSGNIYLDVLRRVRGDFESRDFRARYPYLKSWEESRVMFIFHGTEASQDKDIEQSLLDWGITNGYRASRKESSSNPGDIIIYSRDPYFGPVPEFPKSGISMLTSRVNKGVLKETGLINAKFERQDQPVVEEVLQNLDVDSLLETDKVSPREGKMVNFLKEKYDLNNGTLRQYPVSNGIFLIARDAVNVFTQVAQDIEEHNSWGELKRHLTSDLLNPIIMRNTYGVGASKEILEYARERSQWKDMVDDANDTNSDGSGIVKLISTEVRLRVWYKDLDQICGSKIRINAFAPYSKSEVLFHIAGDVAAGENKRYRKVLGLKDTAMSAPGGVDLSSTANVIQFNHDENEKDPSLQSNISRFKGFEFHIIEYHPILNPIELFLGSSVNKSGPWFSDSSVKSSAHNHEKLAFLK